MGFEDQAPVGEVELSADGFNAALQIGGAFLDQHFVRKKGCLHRETSPIELTRRGRIGHQARGMAVRADRARLTALCLRGVDV
jgi:hypothetical protein